MQFLNLMIYQKLIFYQLVGIKVVEDLCLFLRTQHLKFGI